MLTTEHSLAGKYSDLGSSECLECPAGYYCDIASLSKTVMEADKKCPAGKYCEAGMIQNKWPEWVMINVAFLLTAHGPCPMLNYFPIS